MTFKEWLDNQCIQRSKKLTTRDIVDITNNKFDSLCLNSGLTLSVQANEFCMCEPEETLDTNEYSEVEVYAGEHVSELARYFDGFSLYGHVPVELIQKICDKNGGIKDGKNQQSELRIRRVSQR